MNVTEFLLERLAEDEAEIRKHVHDWEEAGDDTIGQFNYRLHADTEYGYMDIGPAQALAEVKAKRTIVEKSRSQPVSAGEFADGWHWAYGDVLTALATAYQDHPDFPRECTG